MSRPSRRTWPAKAALGMNSCIRFNSRRKVLLPHPDGPIRPVTELFGNRSDTSSIAWCLPNQAWAPMVSRPEAPDGRRLRESRPVSTSRRTFPTPVAAIAAPSKGTSLDMAFLSKASAFPNEHGRRQPGPMDRVDADQCVLDQAVTVTVTDAVLPPALTSTVQVPAFRPLMLVLTTLHLSAPAVTFSATAPVKPV